MNVEFKGKIFYKQHNDNTYYSISDGSKNVDGKTWTNKSWSIRFQGEAPKEESKIEGTGFFSYYQKEKGATVYPTIQVMTGNWSYVDEQPKPNVQSSDLPF